jgi:hypothetical protein
VAALELELTFAGDTVAEADDFWTARRAAVSSLPEIWPRPKNS